MDNHDVEELLRRSAARFHEELAAVDEEALTQRFLAKVLGETTEKSGQERPSEGR